LTLWGGTKRAERTYTKRRDPGTCSEGIEVLAVNFSKKGNKTRFLYGTGEKRRQKKGPHRKKRGFGNRDVDNNEEKGWNSLSEGGFPVKRGSYHRQWAEGEAKTILQKAKGGRKRSGGSKKRE